MSLAWQSSPKLSEEERIPTSLSMGFADWQRLAARGLQ